MYGARTMTYPLDFMQEIYATPGGEGLPRCIQCGVCTASCPNAAKMDYAPRHLMAMVKAGMRDEVLRSNTMWFCVSCYLCAARCPRGIKMTDIMYALKQLAVHDHMTRRGGQTSTFMRTFVENINHHGRVFEPELLTRYYLRLDPRRLLRMVPLALKLLRRGRLPLRPEEPRCRHELRRVAQEMREVA